MDKWLRLRPAGAAAADSDASSQDNYFQGGSPSSLRAPTKAVVAQLSCSSQGVQLLGAMRAVASQTLAQSTLWPSGDAARSTLGGLQELHSCIVSLDDTLDEQRISAGVAAQLDECRQWLKGLQGFVLQLSRHVQGFADEAGPQPAAAASLDDALSSMEEGCSTSCAAPSSAASLAAWRALCQDAADVLGAVVEQMAAGGAEDGGQRMHAAAGGSSRRGSGSKLVAQTSRLSYATHWSQKVAI